jgi:branched-chain amino acid transport system ATP-binding protein
LLSFGPNSESIAGSNVIAASTATAGISMPPRPIERMNGSGRRIMLLDEPSMGLAPLLMKSVFDSLKEINQEGTSILIVEQNARMALKFASRGYLLENGRVVLEGWSEELLANPRVKKAYLGG